VFIEKAEKAPLTRDRRFRIDEKIKSVVAIPLRAGGEKVGVMFVNYRREHRFTDDEKDSIDLFANQTAVAIRNAQLFEKQEKRLKEQSNLLELTRELLGKVEVKESMQVTVDKASELLRAEFCAVVLPEEDSDDLIFNAVHGWDENVIKPIRLKAAYGSQVGLTMKTKSAVYVEDFSKEARFEVHPVIKSLKIRSSLSVPMFAANKHIGAIVVHTRQLRHFNEEDAGLLTLIANQASITLQRARQFEEVNRKRRSLDALYEASKAITASFRPDREFVLSDKTLVLDEIIKQAVEGITRKATLGMIKFYNPATDEFIFESVYPPERRTELLDRINELTVPGVVHTRGARGVVGMAVKTGQPQLEPDVSKCSHYIAGNPSTRSQLAVPLIIDREVRGVINVESDQLAGFDKDDLTNLKALAELAVVVIKNSELFNELIETKGVVDSSNALALMGMTSSIWRHAIEGHAINIQNLATLMRKDFRGWELSGEQTAKLEERFQFIEHISKKILQKEVIPPLSYEGTVGIESINDLIRDRVVELWKSEPHNEAKYTLNLAAEDLRVRVSPEWCRRALDILIDNAVTAVKGLNPHMLTISTRKVKNEIEISVSDTGRGIPPAKVGLLFKKPLGTDDRQAGFGVGLLIAKTIVETYKGKILLQETSNHGTTFNITLPAAE
ncbi:MAG TPA: GAF domain-containing protein, partial [Pyrinomonadaceae bacterium]|nr:GAF domain-containing protein [Pyrinomonadaceae bacterium]